MEWTMSRVGLSQDLRTNKWRITPPCGHTPFVPPTTMLAMQIVECPRCGRSAIADYRNLKIVEFNE